MGDMDAVTINVRLTGRVRRETLNGRQFLVAPATLIVPGVLPGSKGALYYPPEEVSANATDWNHTPLTVGHPTDPFTAEHLSARDPGVLDRQGIGFVRKSVYNGKLQAEAWFDEDRTQHVHKGIYQSLMASRPMELSTGLYTDNEEVAGSHNGRPYTHIARNYRPDHVAILMDQRGACSLADGCGVFNHLTANEWNPEQPRDEKGRFGSGGAATAEHGEEHEGHEAHPVGASIAHPGHMVGDIGEGVHVATQHVESLEHIGHALGGSLHQADLWLMRYED